MVSIYLRPTEIEDRQFPGHLEGDLIKNAANASAVGTLVGRTSRLLMLIKLREFKPASVANVMQGLTDKLLGIAGPMRQSMTYDQNWEMSVHKELRRWRCTSVNRTAPWPRGSNENTSGLVRR